jgi:histidine triad (HIT) family protein
MSVESCVFCRIVDGRTAAMIVHRDRLLVAFRGIRPAAPTHILVVPIQHVSSLNELGASDESLLGAMIQVAHELAVQEQVDDTGYRLVINTGPDAGQSVSHLHLHLLAGRRMSWPPG